MKTIADEIIEIQIKKLFKWVIRILFLIVFLYVVIHVSKGLYDQHKLQVAQCKAYVADVQKVAQLIDDQKK